MVPSITSHFCQGPIQLSWCWFGSAAWVGKTGCQRTEPVSGSIQSRKRVVCHCNINNVLEGGCWDSVTVPSTGEHNSQKPGFILASVSEISAHSHSVQVLVPETGSPCLRAALNKLPPASASQVLLPGSVTPSHPVLSSVRMCATMGVEAGGQPAGSLPPPRGSRESNSGCGAFTHYSISYPFGCEPDLYQLSHRPSL